MLEPNSASSFKVAFHDDIADEDFRKDATNLLARLEELVKDRDSGEREICGNDPGDPAGGLIDREESRLSLDRDDSNPDRPRVERFYEVHRQDPVHRGIVGNGAFGVLSKVEWLGLICAKKKFPDVESINVELVDAFIKETGILVTLHQPHIVKLLCTSSVESKPSFVMELMPMSLSAFIKERKDKGVSGHPVARSCQDNSIIQYSKDAGSRVCVCGTPGQKLPGQGCSEANT